MPCCGDDEPLFSTAKPPLIAAALSRAHLNDARRRLVAIRCACGFQDKETKDGEDEKKDPFVAMVEDFNTHIEQIQSMATDSINDLRERTQIRKDMQSAETILDEMRKVVDDADAELNTAEIKGKSAEKIGLLSDAFRHHRDTFLGCEKLLADAKAMTNNFSWNQPSKLSKSDSYQKALKILAERSGMDLQTSTQEELTDEQEMRAIAAKHQDINLESARETKEQMMMIQKQKRQVKTQLEKIHASVQTVRQMAMALKAETTTQVARLELLDENMKFSVENIRTGNARLERLHKSMQPFNVCVNCCIFIIVLAAAGFLLYRYDVIPIN